MEIFAEGTEGKRKMKIYKFVIVMWILGLIIYFLENIYIGMGINNSSEWSLFGMSIALPLYLGIKWLDDLTSEKTAKEKNGK